MEQFNLVLLKIGYLRFYCPREKAMDLMQVLSDAELLIHDTHYKNGTSAEFAKPMPDGYVSIANANPGVAFKLIRAGEEMEENK